MMVAEKLKNRIREEYKKLCNREFDDIRGQWARGDYQSVFDYIFFFSQPDEFEPVIDLICADIVEVFQKNESGNQAAMLHLLLDLVVGFHSFLPQWNLTDTERNDGVVVSPDVLVEANMKVMGVIETLASDYPAAENILMASLLTETVLRMTAEGVEEPENAAKEFVGNHYTTYLKSMINEIEQSNLRNIVQLRQNGETRTEIGNDFAAHLKHTLFLGASFATTNPPLLDKAWQHEPEKWDPVADKVIKESNSTDVDVVAKLFSLEIVLENMKLLRPIFLLTDGEMGCVCFQVNPKNHADSSAMVEDALFLYETLSKRLGGGVPNVLFKLPGTYAGSKAAEAITARGIGVTITVAFGMFQHEIFAEAIAQGNAIYACLVEMNGRLAYPVRDELLSRLAEMQELGFDEPSLREAAAWAGVAVTRKLHQFLVAQGYSLQHIRPLVASLRLYEGAGYEHLPGAFPDITECLGVSIISVFPNIRRPFDDEPGINLEPDCIDHAVPEHALKILAHSEVFCQAYYLPGEDGASLYEPAERLQLEDEAKVFQWAPIYNTMTEFIASYENFTKRLQERME